LNEHKGSVREISGKSENGGGRKKRKQATDRRLAMGGLGKTNLLHIVLGQAGRFIAHPEVIPVLDHVFAILVHVASDTFCVIFGGFGQGRCTTADQGDRDKADDSR
jgi:hypothetical protein